MQASQPFPLLVDTALFCLEEINPLTSRLKLYLGPTSYKTARLAGGIAPTFCRSDLKAVKWDRYDVDKTLLHLLVELKNGKSYKLKFHPELSREEKERLARKVHLFFYAPCLLHMSRK
jgi:hypothetical protein